MQKKFHTLELPTKADRGTRTPDLRITNAALYQLSHIGIFNKNHLNKSYLENQLFFRFFLHIFYFCATFVTKYVFILHPVHYALEFGIPSVSDRRIMTYQEFLSQVLSMLSSQISSDTTVSLHTVTKNNGHQLDACILRHANFNIAPTIYLNPYYHRFLEGISLEEICMDILSTYQNNLPDKDMDVSFFSCFSEVKKHLVPKLIHRKKNASLLNRIPYVPFLDLAIIFQCQIPDIKGHYGTIQITGEHLSMWNISAEEVYSIAMENGPVLLPPSISSIENCLKNTGEISQSFRFDLSENPIPMFVVTNIYQIHGAVTILYKNLLDQLVLNYGKNLLFLPSSIHEFIFIPLSEEELSEYTPRYFSKMIQEINETVLEDTEILSDHAYYYHGETKSFDILD